MGKWAQKPWVEPGDGYCFKNLKGLLGGKERYVWLLATSGFSKQGG
jgi:hypothetical protein